MIDAGTLLINGERVGLDLRNTEGRRKSLMWARKLPVCFPNVDVFAVWIFFALTAIAVLRLRRTEPDLVRP